MYTGRHPREGYELIALEPFIVSGDLFFEDTSRTLAQNNWLQRRIQVVLAQLMPALVHCEVHITLTVAPFTRFDIEYRNLSSTDDSHLNGIIDLLI